jgi:hypothetical protein
VHPQLIEEKTEDIGILLDHFVDGGAKAVSCQPSSAPQTTEIRRAAEPTGILFRDREAWAVADRTRMLLGKRCLFMQVSNGGYSYESRIANLFALSRNVEPSARLTHEAAR